MKFFAFIALVAADANMDCSAGVTASWTAVAVTNAAPADAAACKKECETAVATTVATHHFCCQFVNTAKKEESAAGAADGRDASTACTFVE